MSVPKTSFIIPVDGSLPSQHATQYVVDAIKNGQQADVHLLNVRPSLSGSVSPCRRQGNRRFLSPRRSRESSGGAEGAARRRRHPLQAGYRRRRTRRRYRRLCREAEVQPNRDG